MARCETEMNYSIELTALVSMLNAPVTRPVGEGIITARAAAARAAVANI